MIERNFISQPLPLPKAGEGDASEQRASNFGASGNDKVVMTDFNVFHATSTQRAKSIEETELDASKLYQEGVEAGKAEATAVYDQTVKVMEMTLEHLKASLESQVKEIEESHARVLMRCLEAVLPNASKHVLRSEMGKVLNQVLAEGLKGQLTARIHPENETAKTFLQSNKQNPIDVVEDSSVSEGKVTFGWENSEIDIDPLRAAEECLSLLRQGLNGGQIAKSPQVPSGDLPALATDSLITPESPLMPEPLIAPEPIIDTEPMIETGPMTEPQPMIEAPSMTEIDYPPMLTPNMNEKAVS